MQVRNKVKAKMANTFRKIRKKHKNYKEMAKELKEIVTALEAEGFTRKEAVKFILAVASGKAGK